MTIYTQIDTGTVDDDGSGDTLRAAFDKVNANYDLQDIAITLDEVTTSADPGAAKGRIWVRDDSPTVLVFTDDTGAETVLGSGGGVTVEDEGTPLATTADTLDFVGDGVVASGTGTTKTITIAAGGGAFTEDATSNSIFSAGAGAALLATGTLNFLAIDGAGGALTTGDNNVAIGSNALPSAITGEQNVAIGLRAMRVATGSNNVAIGKDAGTAIAEAQYNIAIGYEPIHDGGVGALSGIQNVAIGRGSMGGGYLGSCADNIGIGFNTIRKISTGDDNIAIGSGSQSQTSSGDDNISIGRDSGAKITTGSNNVMLGSAAGPTSNQSSKLFINNAESDTPLVGGDFSTGIVTLSGGLRFTERTDHIETPAATFGEIWLRDDGPNVLVFTDDDGTDTVLGGGGGSALEVEDDGVSLSVGVTKFNFIGFNVTEPVDDEIEISFGVSAASNEYCPGYTSYSRVDDNKFTIDLVDAENLFYPGRRVKFDEGGVFDFGVISAVDFDSTSANDTHITLTMEAGDTVPTGVFDVCLVSSATAWSPIAGDPFGGESINDICTGVIGGTQWWFAVGQNGKIATSSDGGATWTLRTTITTEHINVCTYDSSNEVFWAGGDAGVLVSSSNGTTMVEDTTSIPALAGTVTDNILGIVHTDANDQLCLIYESAAGTHGTVSSTDKGVTWTARASLGTAGSNRAITHITTTDGVTGPGLDAVRSGQVTLRTLSSATDTTFASGNSMTPHIPKTSVSFYDTAGAKVGASADGTISGLGGGWVGIDDVTFGQSVNTLAYSGAHGRVVCGGNNQQMGYWDVADKAVADAWRTVENGFSPTANILAIAWNDTDAVFVAVANNGQICRSSNGLGTTPAPVTHNGFTLIAADPMAGGAINDIAVGSIGGTIYWVICGSGGQIFTSTDEGVTWTSRASGLTANLVTIGFDTAGEQFMVGGGAGEFSTTTDGTTWTGNTADVPAITGLGSSNIIQVVFDDTAGLWWLLYAGAAAANVTITAAPSDLTSWTIRDTNVVVTFGSSFALYNNDNGSRIYVDEIDDVFVYNGSTNSLNVIVITDANLATVSAGHAKIGTNGNAMDFIIGTEDGDLSMAFTTIRALSPGVLSGPVRDIAFTTVSGRYVAVGDSNQIYTLAAADTESTGRWEEVINPFTGNIIAVAYGVTDDIIIAVGSNGEIGRSVDGIS